MKYIFLGLIFLYICSCTNVTTNTAQSLDEPQIIDTLNIDTNTLKGKREFILNNIITEVVSISFDTLMDLNYDGEGDYVIGYYGASGTGFKNNIEVYLFDKQQNRYIFNDQLSEISNPTFYLNQKKITGFYIGNGSGEGEKLEWIDKKWETTKIFSVVNENNGTIWKVTYPLTGKTQKILQPYQMTPPENILETKIIY